MSYYNASYLAHYGVKGMKWGVRRKRNRSLQRADRKNWKSMSRKERKANRDNKNSRYSSIDRSVDKDVYGESGVKRINRRMNKGQSHFRASLSEAVGQTAKATTASVGVLAGVGFLEMGSERRRAVGNFVNNYAKMKAQDLINLAKSKNAERIAREMIPKLSDGINQTVKLKPWQYKVD